MKTHLTNEIQGTYTKKDWWFDTLMTVATVLFIIWVVLELGAADAIIRLVEGV